MATRFPLKDPLPLRFTEFDRKLYAEIMRDPSARIAFGKMTSGSRAMDASMLLIRLGGCACSSGGKDSRRYANKSHEKEAWEKWSDALEGLKRNGKSLRHISRKMKKHLVVVQARPPGEWGYVMEHERGQSYLALFEGIPHVATQMSDIPADIRGAAAALEALCMLGKEWRRVAVRAKEREIQMTVGLLTSVKEDTGRCHFELMRDLINVGRRLTGESEETAESLRSMWRTEVQERRHAF